MKEGGQDNKKPPGSALYDAADNARSSIATPWPKQFINRWTPSP